MAFGKLFARKKTDEKEHARLYNWHPMGIQCIDITEQLSFNNGCAVDAIWRSKNAKNPAADLQEAIGYLQREFDRVSTFKGLNTEVSDKVLKSLEDALEKAGH